jgi:hypothetical protein
MSQHLYNDGDSLRRDRIRVRSNTSWWLEQQDDTDGFRRAARERLETMRRSRWGQAGVVFIHDGYAR